MLSSCFPVTIVEVQHNLNLKDAMQIAQNRVIEGQIVENEPDIQLESIDFKR